MRADGTQCWIRRGVAIEAVLEEEGHGFRLAEAAVVAGALEKRGDGFAILRDHHALASALDFVHQRETFGLEF